MSKEHKLRSINDIRRVVTKENFDNFIIDFTAFLALNIQMSNEIDSDDFKELIKIVDYFHWIDDGKNDISIKLEIKSK